MPPLMPRATAVWLVDNTSLTFEQISNFCGLHVLEIRSIADGEVSFRVQALDPVARRELTREEIARCEADPHAQLHLTFSQAPPSSKRVSRYTPIARRQSRPQAIAWLLRQHPKLPDSQIVKLIGTTRKMIGSIRDRSYRNIVNVRPQDPVLLGLCTQQGLNEALRSIEQESEPQRDATDPDPPELPEQLEP